jgi:hypothetical protein
MAGKTELKNMLKKQTKRPNGMHAKASFLPLKMCSNT